MRYCGIDDQNKHTESLNDIGNMSLYGSKAHCECYIMLSLKNKWDILSFLGEKKNSVYKFHIPLINYINISLKLGVIGMPCGL